jgi:uncharacterized protein (TIGR02246 family)
MDRGDSMTDLNFVSQWIDSYVNAWNTNEREDIARLFTEDAVYATEPYRPPWRGSQEIVAKWLEHKDKPGETSFEWQPISITDEVAVVSGTTRYPTTVYSNLWVIRLAPDGRCKEFSEWWMEHPKAASPGDT